MISYLKTFLLALISAPFAALPVSHGAHFAFLSNVLHFAGPEQSGRRGFYYAVISVTFSLVAFVALRKLYFAALSAPFLPERDAAARSAKRARLRRLLHLSLSVLPALVLVIPVQLPLKNVSYLVDVFVSLLGPDYLLVTAFCCAANGLFLFISFWYAARRTVPAVQAARTPGVLRFAVYQVPAHFLPGLSHVGLGATNLLLTDVAQTGIVREALFYYTPALFLVNVVRIVRYLVGGLVVDPRMAAVAVGGALLGCIPVVALLSRINLKKTFIFFALYSIVFGGAIAVYAFWDVLRTMI